jgi:hypothetical protein
MTDGGSSPAGGGFPSDTLRVFIWPLAPPPLRDGPAALHPAALGTRLWHWHVPVSWLHLR